MRNDPRNSPNYSITEAASYLGIPAATLRFWVKGRGDLPGIIVPADKKSGGLSFFNLVEAHVLTSLRRHHGVTFQRIRRATEYTAQSLGVDRPLLNQNFETDGLDIFVRELGRLINVSRHGQLAIRDVMNHYLRRVERDAHGVPIKLRPMFSGGVIIDPGISFGRPVLIGTGIPIEEIADRFRGGDPIENIAEDLGVSLDAAEEAVRCQLAA